MFEKKEKAGKPKPQAGTEAPVGKSAPAEKEAPAAPEPVYLDRNKPFNQHNGPDFSYVEQGGKFFNVTTRKELTKEEKDKLGIK